MPPIDEKQETRPPLPPFTEEMARQKVSAAQDAWNTRDPEKVSLAYTEDSKWRNRDEFFEGRETIVEFLWRKWARELDYRLMKELSGVSQATLSRFASNTSRTTRVGSGGDLTSTTGLQHLPALRLRVVLDREPSRRSYHSDAGKARATLTLEGEAA